MSQEHQPRARESRGSSGVTTRHQRGDGRSIRDLFTGLQTELEAALARGKGIGHPGAQGDVSEADWHRVLADFLPSRYAVAKAIVIDSTDARSEQLDAVVYDRQYSPRLFRGEGATIIPAESVYAVFEVRPQLNRSNVRYAGEKAASVRRLHRTSVPVVHAGGRFDPRSPGPIIAGILCQRSGWTGPLGDRLRRSLEELTSDQRLDLGCALSDGSFEAFYADADLRLETREGDVALAFLALRLMGRLQSLGTVPAVDLTAYERRAWGSADTTV